MKECGLHQMFKGAKIPMKEYVICCVHLNGQVKYINLIEKESACINLDLQKIIKDPKETTATTHL